MDLIRRQRFVGLLALAGAGITFVSCENPDFRLEEDAVVLPASLIDAYPVALTVARDWSDDVFLQSAGGGFTVLDSTGNGNNHSYRFHSLEKKKYVIVHLFSGIPYTEDATDVSPPPPLFVNFIPFDRLLDSDDVVPSAIDRAEEINAGSPGTIPPATDFAARLLSIPVWPEGHSIGDSNPDSLAWRVDFLVEQEYQGADTYFSVARFYIHPRTGQHLGDPEVPLIPELYPFPQGFP